MVVVVVAVVAVVGAEEEPTDKYDYSPPPAARYRDSKASKVK